MIDALAPINSNLEHYNLPILKPNMSLYISLTFALQNKPSYYVLSSDQLLWLVLRRQTRCW